MTEMKRTLSMLATMQPYCTNQHGDLLAFEHFCIRLFGSVFRKVTWLAIQPRYSRGENRRIPF